MKESNFPKLQFLISYIKGQWINVLLFISALILSVWTNQFWWMLIPFIWLLFPVCYGIAINATELLFWIMLCMLPLSTELEVTDSLGLDFPDEPLQMLLTGAFILSIIKNPRFFPRSCLKSNLFFIVIIHMCWLVVCCFFSTNPILSIKFLLARTWYIIPFVLLPQIMIETKKDFIKVAYCLLLPMLFVVCQALIRHSFLSFSFEGVKKIYDPYFRNHVNYSAMLVCLIAVSCCIWYLTSKNNPFKKWMLASIVIAVAGLILSFSRGAWVALLAGIITAVIIHFNRMKEAIVLFCVSMFMLCVWLNHNNNYLRFAPDYTHTIFHTNFTEHLKATVSLKDVSDAERFYRWIAAVKMIAAKPYSGFGPNNFYANYKIYTSNLFKTWVSSNNDHSTVHNYLLKTALEQGIPGLIIILVLFGSMLIRSQTLYLKLHDPFYKYCAMTIGVVIIMILTLNMLSDLIETDKIGSLFWLCLGFLILLEHPIKQKIESSATTKISTQ